METLPLPLQKNSNTIMLLKEGSLLTLAVFSSYDSLKSLVSSLCTFIQSYETEQQFLQLVWKFLNESHC